MLEIIGLVFYARYLGRRTLAKGYSKGHGAGIAVGLWLVLEILGISLGFALLNGIGVDTEGGGVFLMILFAVIGIGLSILASALIVRGMPVQKERILAKIRSREGTEEEQCAWVMGLAELGSEALPQLLELYEQELQWPRSERVRIALVQAIEKAGGREYLTRIRM